MPRTCHRLLKREKHTKLGNVPCKIQLTSHINTTSGTVKNRFSWLVLITGTDNKEMRNFKLGNRALNRGVVFTPGGLKSGIILN